MLLRLDGMDYEYISLQQQMSSMCLKIKSLTIVWPGRSLTQISLGNENVFLATFFTAALPNYRPTVKYRLPVIETS